MTFWDTSALAPLIYEEEDSLQREGFLSKDPRIVLWYGTPMELESALSRRVREGSLSMDQAYLARKKVERMAASWLEVEPSREVRDRALRLLRVHCLRSADAFQLSAALIVTNERPAGHWFLTADNRLTLAAEAEGFSVE